MSVEAIEAPVTPVEPAANPATESAVDPVESLLGEAFAGDGAETAESQPEVEGAEKAAEPVEEGVDLDNIFGDDAEPAPAAEPAATTTDVAGLNKLLEGKPDLKAAIDADPEVSAFINNLARRSADLGKYEQVFETPERARAAHEKAQTLDNLDNIYAGNDSDAFLTHLYEANQQAYNRHMLRAVNLTLNNLATQADRAGRKDLLAAAQSIYAVLNGQTAQPAAGADTSQLPPEVQQRLARAEELERQLQEQNRQREQAQQIQAQQAQSEFANGVVADFQSDLRKAAEDRLAKSGLAPRVKAALVETMVNEVIKAAQGDRRHLAQMQDEFTKSINNGLKPEDRARMTRLLKGWAGQNVAALWRPILQDAGVTLKQREAQVQQKAQQAQREGGSVVKGASGASVPAAANTVQSFRERKKQIEQKMGRRLTDQEILDL